MATATFRQASLKPVPPGRCVDRFAEKFQDRGLRFSEAEVSSGDWIFDDEERFALMLLGGKFEFRSKLSGACPFNPKQKTLRS